MTLNDTERRHSPDFVFFTEFRFDSSTLIVVTVLFTSDSEYDTLVTSR